MKIDTFADNEDIVCREIAGWKTNIKSYSATKSDHWWDTRPSAVLFQKSMLKSSKIWCISLLYNYVGLQTFWTPHVYTHDDWNK